LYICWVSKQVNDKEIYFHVGLGKTGSTFLQYNVFPKLKGVHYIQRTRYKQAIDIIKRTKHQRYFVSNEFDQQLEEEVLRFSSVFPNTTPIIVFRRQDEWIASQYRRFIKNGHTFPFNEFIDLENDTGYFKIKDLQFYDMIGLLQKHFTKPPLVLFYNDMKHQPKAFIDKIAKVMGATFDINSINLNPKHTSYNTKQLKAIKYMATKFDLRKRKTVSNVLLRYFNKLYYGIFRYTILYGAKIMPSNLFDEKPLINPLELEHVKKYFKEDWNCCLRYIA